METQNTQAELDALFHRVRLEITSKREDLEDKAKAELARFQKYYDIRKRELATGEPTSLFDGWQDRDWWKD
jgi:hypothetical protein